MRQVFVWLLRFAGLLLLALALGFALLSWQVDRLGQQDDARPSDVVVVLGARVEADGRPGSDLTSRTYHAVDLYQAGMAPYLICTGGVHGEPLSAAAVCSRFAQELGVPVGRIRLADGSSSTAGDALATARVMHENGWRTAVLVSHPLHLFRARWLFDRAGVIAVTSPTTTETDRIFPPLRFWYAIREAGAVATTVLEQQGLMPGDWNSRLQAWSYVLP